MSENFDFDADLNSLLGIGGAATTSRDSTEAAAPATQPEPQETASGLPEPDLVALLDPEGLAQQQQQVAGAVQSTEDRAEPTAKEPRLPVMYDSEGRKLGPTGVLVTLQGELRGARVAGDKAEIDRLAGLVKAADEAVEAIIKKSGLSRAQLFPGLTRQSAVDQGEAIERIAALRREHDELEGQIRQGGRPGRVYMLRMLAQRCRGQSALLARQAGLIEQHELGLAGRYGFWALMPPAICEARGGGGPDGGKDRQPPETAREIEVKQEVDRS